MRPSPPGRGWPAGATGSAGGKTILLGEHAVVHGSEALALPIQDLRIQVDLSPGGGWSVDEGVDLDPLRRARDAVLDAAGWSGAPPHVATRATLPPACGLGSSAAFSVALARAVLAALGRPAAPEDVGPLADRAEAVFHGNPSGIDVATVLSDAPIRFRKGAAPAPVAVGGAFHLWVVDTGIRSSTSRVVGAVADLRRRRHDVVEAHFRRIAGAVRRGIAALAGGSVDALGAAMDDAMHGLRGIGVSHPVIEDVIRAALDGGATSAKLSGAGRGGVVLLLAPDAGWDPGPSVAGCRVLARARLGSDGAPPATLR